MTEAISLRDRHLAVRGLLEEKAEALGKVIPQGCGLVPSRAIGVVLELLTRKPDLLECEPRSVVRCVNLQRAGVTRQELYADKAEACS